MKLNLNFLSLGQIQNDNNRQSNSNENNNKTTIIANNTELQVIDHFVNILICKATYMHVTQENHHYPIRQPFHSINSAIEGRAEIWTFHVPGSCYLGHASPKRFTVPASSPERLAYSR